MKVLYISNAGDWAGSTIALKNLLTKLIPMGVKPLVVCKFKGSFTEWLDENLISYEIIDFDWSYVPLIANYRDFFAHYWRIYKYINKEKHCIKTLQNLCLKFKPDIIHSNNGIIQIGYKVAKKMDIKHVWHLREYQTLDFGMKPYPSMQSFKKMLKNSYSIAITRDIQKFFELQTEKSKVIYDGVLHESYRRYTPKKDNYFLYIGRIEKSKGIDALLEVFSEFSKQNKDINLMIAGEGKSEFVNKMKHYVSENILNNRVQFLGYRNDRFDLMYAATATIVPSRFEGFGFITIEAILNGSPIIGNNTAGTAEIAENSNGKLFLYKTKSQLLDQMKTIIHCDTSFLETNTTLLQKDAARLYSIEKCAKEVFKMYKSLL